MGIEKIKGKTNVGLVDYASKQVGKPYWCGTFGQTATLALYEYNKKRLPEFYKANDFKTQLGKRVHDCVGLIKGYMWSETPYSQPVYNASQDVTVDAMYRLSKVAGPIAAMPLVNGMLVFNHNLSHVGVFCVNGFVYEARGHAYGVIKSKFYEDNWSYYSECPYIEYDYNGLMNDDDHPYTVDTRKLPELYYGKTGKAVEVWQEIVGNLECDGVFGSNTKKQTILMQQFWFPTDHNEWDGIVGAKTWAKGLKSLR